MAPIVWVHNNCNPKEWAVLPLLLLVMAGCSSARPSSVRVVSEKEVAGMALVGDVHGFSGWYGLFGAAGYQNARNDALEQAEQLGATHVVLDPQVANYGGTQVNGKAYKSP